MAAHLIKKYANRKLYDTTSKHYVTLETVARLVQDGHDIRVVDQPTGSDITSMVLNQILFDRGPGRRSGLPDAVLVDLVKERGEQLMGMFRSSLTLPRELGQRAADGIERGAQSLDDAISTGMRNLNIASADDMEDLRQQIQDLRQQVAMLHTEVSGRSQSSWQRAGSR